MRERPTERNNYVWLRRLEARRKKSNQTAGIIAEPVDRARYAWYDPTCPCGLPPGDCKVHPRARASQRPPEGNWSRRFLMAGRGFGKTKAGAEWVKHLAETGQAERIALVAATAAAIRNIMIAGKSGILAVCPPWFRPVYARSLQRLTWPNGVIAECYSADKPERLRGPEHGHAWIDEPGTWRYDLRAYNMLMLRMRVGVNPKLVATSTPRPTKLFFKGSSHWRGIRAVGACLHPSSLSFVLRPVLDPLSLSSLHCKPPPNPLRICHVWGCFVNCTL